MVVKGGFQKNRADGRYAAHAKALVDYQKAMQGALREVTDTLSELEALGNEREVQVVSIKSSKKTVELIKEQYDEGVTSSTELFNAESGQLAAERRLVEIRGQQFVATVKLLEALGGGCSKGCFSR